MSSSERRLVDLVRAYGLDSSDLVALRRLLELIANDPRASTTVRDPDQAVDVHVADSLSGLDCEPVRAASSLADIGSGAGFPGLVLAIACRHVSVRLVESSTRKAAFLTDAARELGLDNVGVVADRVEDWAERAEPQDVVTARAVASLPVLFEYAAPLLRIGGHAVLWKGRLEAGESAAGAAAAEQLGLSLLQALPVDPYPGVRDHRLVVAEKVAETPSRFPRRSGIAHKRPIA